VSITLTLTTTFSNSAIQTITTIVQTAYSATLTTSASASAAVAKFMPSATAIAKAEASPAPSSGLSPAAFGGIITAAAVVVTVVAVATWLILRHLNKVVRVAEAAKSGSRSNKKSSSRPHGHRPTPSDISGIDALSVDPLMMSESGDTLTPRSIGVPRPSAVHSSQSDLDPAISPPIPASYRSPDAYNGGYQQVPMSESHYSDNLGHHRHSSVDLQTYSRSPERGFQPGYFDLDPALRDQNLWFGRQSRRPSTHARQWSDTSDVSQLSGTSVPVELDAVDAGIDGNQLSGLQRVIRAAGMTRIGNRRHSAEKRRKGSTSGGTGPARRDLGAAPGMKQRLDNVVESDSPIHAKGKGTGALGSERDKDGIGDGRSKHTGHKYTQSATDLGITMDIAAPASEAERHELEKRERQKVVGNLYDFRGR
jgi:hypothetical protein